MKNRILYTCLCFVLLSVQCRKSDLRRTDTLGLPPATQIGANTFGFLLNGQPWVPSGNNGSGNNLSIDYDPGFKNGILGITSYRVINESKIQYYGIGIDSLNSYTSIHNYKFYRNGALISNANFNGCSISSDDSNSLISGELMLLKYDKVNRIIAGSFTFTFKNNCDSFKITNGRFDFKF